MAYESGMMILFDSGASILFNVFATNRFTWLFWHLMIREITFCEGKACKGSKSRFRTEDKGDTSGAVL